MMIAESDPSGRHVYPMLSRPFFDLAKPQTEEWHAAFNKWNRGITYLEASQLR